MVFGISVAATLRETEHCQMFMNKYKEIIMIRTSTRAEFIIINIHKSTDFGVSCVESRENALLEVHESG